MKRSMLIVPLLAVSLSAGLGAQTAMALSAGSESTQGCQKEMRGHRQERMAAVLGLSTDQQQQIQTLRQDARKEMEPLHEALAANRGKLKALIAADDFDESAVRSLAVEETSTRTELIVVRARLAHQIQAVLTPDQRALAKKLRPLVKERRGHGERNGTPDGEEL